MSLNGEIALLGAGHIACRFLNVLGLGDLVSYVLDDHPDKKGVYMPGTRHPIISTEQLDRGSITACLLSLSAVGEQKIMSSKLDFTHRGGKFFSIIPTSYYALPI